MKALLFNINDIKARSFLHENISESKLMILCERVQDSYIQNLLGDTLYNTLQNKVINNNLSSQDVELISNYLLPCFVIKLEMTAIVNYNIDYRNLSVGSVIDSQLQPLTVEQIKFYLDEKQHELHVVEAIAIHYICKNYGIQGEAIRNQRESGSNIYFL